MTEPNPFKPTFGMAPPELIGRGPIIEDIHDGIMEGIGSPLRAVLLTGPLGMGKTVLLDAAREAAEREQWVAAEVSASTGMLKNILDGTRHGLAHLLVGDSVHLDGIGMGPFSIQVSRETEPEPSWRYQMNRLLDLLAQHGTGLMITVDEVNPGLGEMRDLALTLGWARCYAATPVPRHLATARMAW
ncbi:MAG: ATP-binding protein [Bifidobacteriaceae bacterium]|nr:ATP-binding protein [Bifidobacteriaceae bacterium]